MNSQTVLVSIPVHTSSVKSIKKLNDGRMVSASEDKSIAFWDQNGGGLQKLSNAHLSGINALEITLVGYLASGSDDKKVTLWNTQTYVSVISLDHGESVLSLKILNNGNLASGGADHTIKIWSMSTYSLVNTLTGHTGNVNALETLTDGRLLSSGDDQTVIVWNSNGGSPSISSYFNPFNESIYALKTLINGDLAISGAQGSLKFWQITGSTQNEQPDGLSSSSSCAQGANGYALTQIDVATLIAGFDNGCILMLGTSQTYQVNYQLFNPGTSGITCLVLESRHNS